jgi:HD-GYP domain-containing protein (c-di-GMP phosphodiesterase class II)
VSDGSALVAGLSAARKAIQLYPPMHPSYIEAIGMLVGSVAEATADGGDFVLNVHQGRLYCGSRVMPGDSPALAAVSLSLEGHGVESLTFHPGFGETDAAGLAAVLNLRPSSVLSVADELTTRGIAGVTIAALSGGEDREDREERDQQRAADRALYRQLIAAMRTLTSNVREGKPPEMEQAAGIVEHIMERLVADEATVLGMATMSAHNEAAFFHSVNVMIYSLTLGVGLGLPDEGLVSLGMSALFHDVGKAAFDLHDPQQARTAQTLHPQYGAEILSQIPDSDRAPMLVAFEHHMGQDGTGYPERSAEYFTHPYSRMVAIADRYDNLTKRDAVGDSLTPDRAVIQLLREAGKALDPTFCRLFVKALGVFPVGCVVRLSDQSVGVVRATSADPMLPRVRLVWDADGRELDPPREVDLTEDGRSVVEVLESDSLNLTVSDRL